MAGAFQQRHYVAIARVLAETDADEEIVNALADMFAADSDKFKRSLFLAAASRESSR